MSPEVRQAGEFRLSLNAALVTIAGVAIAFATLGPAALVVVTAAAMIGAMVGGISAGIQVAACTVVTTPSVSGHRRGDPEPRREPRTMLALLHSLFKRGVRRLAAACGWLIPVIVGCAATAGLFGFVSWWLVGMDSTLISDNLAILLVLTLLLAALGLVIALIGRKLIRWPTVRTRLLIGVQVLWDITEPIRVPRAAWPRPLSGIHWLLITSPVWLRVTLGWVVAATDFFFLYVIFSSLGFELLYHSPAGFSWAMWLLDLMALAILVRAHYDIARAAFSRKVSIAWGIIFSAIDAYAWFYMRDYLIAGGVYLFLVLGPILGTSITRPDPFRLWFCLALVIALFAGKSLVRTIRPIIPSIEAGRSTAPRPRWRAMIVMDHVAIVLGCLLALTWIVQMQRRAESYFKKAESLAVKAAQYSPKAAPAGAAQPARDRARFEYYSGLQEKYYEAACRPWSRVQPDPPEP
jgi:hypothetical protein